MSHPFIMLCLSVMNIAACACRSAPSTPKDATDEQVEAQYDSSRCREHRYTDAIELCLPNGEIDMSLLGEVRLEIERVYKRHKGELSVKVAPIQDVSFLKGKFRRDIEQGLGAPDSCQRSIEAEKFEPGGGLPLMDVLHGKRIEKPGCGDLPVWIYGFGIESEHEAEQVKTGGFGWAIYATFNDEGVCQDAFVYIPE